MIEFTLNVWFKIGDELRMESFFSVSLFCLLDSMDNLFLE